MNSNVKKIYVIGLSVMALAGCASTASPNAHSENFGLANQTNIAAQFVEPSPAQKANTFIPADRSRRELARKRYREDDVEKPRELSTND